MMAQVFSSACWVGARARRAARGKAPRLAVRRSILMRETPGGGWRVGIFEWRFGKWQQPRWLCASVPFEEARDAVDRAWRQYRLPLGWGYAADRHLRPFVLGVSEPIGGVA